MKNKNILPTDINNILPEFTLSKTIFNRLSDIFDNTGYICPVTNKQCDDECCVSAEDCHLKTTSELISDCDPTKDNNIDKFLKFVSDEKSPWIEDLEYYNENKEELDLKFEAELNNEILKHEADKLFGKLETGIGAERKKIWMNGARWQQKQLYSEEDMHKLMDEYQDYLCNTIDTVKTFKEWFKQNKNKIK